jgi:molybdopterin converting factor small subunit
MTVRVELPAPLRECAQGSAVVHVEATTVREALAALTARFPTIRRHLYDDRGVLRGYVNLYVNEDPVDNGTGGADTPLAPGDALLIVPSVAGGRSAEPPSVRGRRVDDERGESRG